MNASTMPRFWIKDELLLAMNLYCKLPFGRMHARNPDIIALSSLLGRTPSSLAMKLVNLASLDPVHQARGVSGLKGVAALDREVWSAFEQDWDGMAFASEQLLAERRGVGLVESAEIAEVDLPRQGKERERMVRQRVNQNFFRSTVLAAYNGKCCVTSISATELLVASHVVPWAVDVHNRMNPRNGLCLNALHDKAFDRGLMTLSDDYAVMLSPKLLKLEGDSTAVTDMLLRYEGHTIALPKKYQPSLDFVRWHRANCFIAAA
jgi:putative restriction endonuclease